MKIERRVADHKVEFRAGETGGAGVAVGYGSVFNSVSENLGGFREIIAPGAFDDVLDNDVRALINHDSNLILGRTTSKTLRLSVDEIGLRYEVDLPNTSYANDLAVVMERGDVSQSSFGFQVDKDSWSEDEDGRIIRTVEKVSRLYDVSPVTFPAYPEATAAKRSLEQFKTTHYEAETESRSREMYLAGVVTPS